MSVKLLHLGIALSQDLSWNLDIENTVNKYSRTMGSLKRNSRLALANLRLTAYVNLVRSKLEYGSIIWNPYQSYLINQLEPFKTKQLVSFIPTIPTIPVLMNSKTHCWPSLLGLQNIARCL